MIKQNICPCSSGLCYEDCCVPLHQGKQLPSTALLLMRSRYSAYAKGLASYIIQTTHSQNLLFRQDISAWEKEIREFSQQTKFHKLEILEFFEEGEHATVTFIAHLSQKGRDISFIEKSGFIKVNGRWLYLTGEVRPYASHDFGKS